MNQERLGCDKSGNAEKILTIHKIHGKCIAISFTALRKCIRVPNQNPKKLMKQKESANWEGVLEMYFRLLIPQLIVYKCLYHSS